MNRLALCAAVCLAAAVILPACEKMPDPKTLIPPDGKYNVKILRDEFGVPHVYGKTDADCAYGLAWAQCEDDFATLEESLFVSRGMLASVQGRQAAPIDYIVKLFRFREIVDEKYDTELAPETRRLVEAFADGCNHFAALHLDKATPGAYPVTGKDIVAGFAIKSPMFFGFDGELRRLMEGRRKKQPKEQAALDLRALLTKDLEIGSNTFAIAPSRTPDGKTHLAINSHQPWTGQVAWYEARLKSEEGLDIVGGVFPGTPVILHGHNRNLGWAHTVNSPDLVDIYELEINPENPNQYKFDGEWKELEKGRATITIRLWGNLKLPIPREVLYSVYGPALRTSQGVFAIRYAGYGEIRQVEQWYRMGKSTNIDEFEQALRIRAIPSFNIGYGDKAGNIWYVYNALLPVRAEGYDWQDYLPGNTSATLWTEYLPFERLPQVRNPKAGFIQNANCSPYVTTANPENPRPEDYSPTLGIETRMTNRGIRLMELLGADESITEEEFYAYKFDLKYSDNSPAAELRQQIVDGTKSTDPVVREAVEVLRNWDGGTEVENRGTAVAVLAMEPVVRAMLLGGTVPDPIKLFEEKAKVLYETFGRVDVPWGEVNRLVRGDVNLPLSGGPDVLHAVYGDWKGKHLEAVAGDCYILMATWDKDGAVHSRSIHQFGSATLDANSPHYADQAPMFVRHEMKPVRLDEADLRQHLTAEYRPGEARPGT